MYKVQAGPVRVKMWTEVGGIHLIQALLTPGHLLLYLLPFSCRLIRQITMYYVQFTSNLYIIEYAMCVCVCVLKATRLLSYTVTMTDP